MRKLPGVVSNIHSFKFTDENPGNDINFFFLFFSRLDKNGNKTIEAWDGYCFTYMRRWRGKPREWNWLTKLLTELSELRSRAITMISESGHSDTIRAFASSAAFTLRAGRINLAPRFANTRAVSAPIPDVAPDNNNTAHNFHKY